MIINHFFSVLVSLLYYKSIKYQLKALVMIQQIKTLLIISLAIFLFNSCVPPEKKEITQVRIDLNDEVYRKIIEFQDQQLTDSLTPYFDHDDPTYRFASIMAFSSIQDSSVINKIIKKLNDSSPKVREAAAYTLGQLGNKKSQDSLLAAFGKFDTLNPNNSFNSNILEAIGKIGDLKYLKPLATVKSYRPTDTLLLLGQTEGLYHYILRGMSVSEGTERVIDLISSNIYPNKVKSLCSYYLVRAKKEDLNNYKYRIAKLFKRESNPIIQMNLAIALGKTQDSEALEDLKEVLADKKTESSVKVNILKAFGNFPYIDVAEIVLKNLEDENNNVAMAAAEYFYNHGEPNDVMIYRRNAKKDLAWNIKAKLYSAILKHIPTYFSKTKAATIWDIKKQINSSENPYEKAEFIRCLGEDINSLKLIYDLGYKAPEVQVRTASIEALTILVKKESLKTLSKAKLKRITKEIINIVNEAFSSGDVGLITTAVEVLDKSVLDLKPEFENFDFLTKSKLSLKLPKDIEAYNAILKLENKWLNKSNLPHKIKYNNPIDWKIFDQLSDSTQALVKTNKGSFTMELFKNESPGTVTNFVKLVNKKFFEGKKFHRVVPNFVIQTGCPRGDGYGSLDYTIRSEFSQLHYNEVGFVGMASAGKDTESTQWFVTLAPTPHLDGKYTIFGRVTQGLNTVKKITIGDIIQSIDIIN